MLKEKLLNKKTIECASVVVLAGVLTLGAVLGGAAPVEQTEVATAEATVVDAEPTLYGGYLGDTEYAEVTIEVEDVATVAAVEEEPEVTYTEEELEWLDKLLPDVEESLNVRAEASAEAELVGKLYKGDLAEVIEEGETWTKIKSGNVEGYVLNEYCVIGLDALAYAQENIKTVATVTTDGLRVRGEQSTEGSVITSVSTGYELEVAKDTEAEEGWVAVLYKGNTYYVVAEYVEIGYDLGTGITVEEEAAKIAAEQEAKRREEEKRAQQSSGAATSYNAAVGSVDDVTLLAALVYCEAGNCSYEQQLAVASVVCNRVRSGAYPGSVYAVIYQGGQFGPASSGKLATVVANGSYSSTSVAAAQAALSGQDNTDGAIGFQYASSGRAGVVYGSVVFFK